MYAHLLLSQRELFAVSARRVFCSANGWSAPELEDWTCGFVENCNSKDERTILNETDEFHVTTFPFSVVIYISLILLLSQ